MSNLRPHIQKEEELKEREASITALRAQGSVYRQLTSSKVLCLLVQKYMLASTKGSLLVQKDSAYKYKGTCLSVQKFKH